MKNYPVCNELINEILIQFNLLSKEENMVGSLLLLVCVGCTDNMAASNTLPYIEWTRPASLSKAIF